MGLPTAYGQLLIANCQLYTAKRLLITDYCLLLTTLQYICINDCLTKANMSGQR